MTPFTFLTLATALKHNLTEETTNTREKHFQVFNKSFIDVNKIDAAGIRHDNENELYVRQTSA